MQEMVASCVSLHAAIPYSDVDPSDTQHYSLLVPVVGREGDSTTPAATILLTC